MNDLKPASEKPWYQLATLAGDDHPENVRLWNGYQRVLLERAEIFDPTDGDMKNLPYLNEDELKKVEEIKELPHHKGATILIHFPHTEFQEVDFSNFYFGFTTTFRDSTFREFVEFKGTIFVSDVRFCKTSFEEGANFFNANFGGKADFIESRFSMFAVFADVTFNDLTDFSGATFISTANFSVTGNVKNAVPMHFRGATFSYHPPSFFGRKIHEDTDWTDTVWPEAVDNEKQLKSNIREYEQLSLSARELGKTSDEHLFFRKEMECRRVLVRFEKKCLCRLVSVTPFWIFRTFSSYGYSFERPAGWLLFLWLLGPIGYFLYFSFCRPLSGIGWSSILQDSMIFSTANMLPFFGFHSRFPLQLLDVESGLIFLFSVGQTILGFILLFFLGLGLRNRFRLK